MSLLRTLFKWTGGLVGWVLILFGAPGVAFSLAGLVSVLRGATPGEPMYLDALTPTVSEAIQMLIFSGSILFVGIGIRHISGKAAQPRAKPPAEAR